MAAADGTVTVTLNASAGVSGYLYCTDNGGAVHNDPAENFLTYTAPFTVSDSDCLWIIAVFEDGYSIDRWSTGEKSNPYRLYHPTQNVALGVTAVKVDSTAAPTKNGSFAGQPAFVINGALVVSDVNFPDTHFLMQVQKLSSAADGLLTMDEITAITQLDVSESFIEDLSGIEFFSALTTLNCSGNRLAALDVSHNSKLKVLNAADQSVCAAPIKVDEEYRVYLSELPGVDISKVSNVQGANVAYNPGTGVVTTAGLTAITYSYDTGLNGAAMNVTTAHSTGSELKTNNAVLFPDATFYTAGENYIFALRGLVEGLATVSVDFIRETIDDYVPKDEDNSYPVFSLQELRESTFSQQFVISLHLDDSIAIDPDALPEMVVWIEGENSFGYANPLFVPKVNSASWNAEERLLQYTVSSSINASFLFTDGNAAGKLAVDEMIKRYYADLRFIVDDLVIPASVYQTGEEVKLNCTVAASQRDSFIIPTADGVEEKSQYFSYICFDEWNGSMQFSSYVPAGLLQLEGSEDPEPNTFSFLISDSKGKEIEKTDRVGAGSLTFGALYYPLHSQITAAISQIAGSDSDYDYDDSVWLLTFAADGSAPIYKKAGEAGAEAAFTNRYYEYQITFITQPEDGSVIEDGDDLFLNAAVTVSANGSTELPAEEAVLTWYACDKDGNIIGEVLETGSRLFLSFNNPPDVQYFKCVASFSNARPVSSRVAEVRMISVSHGDANCDTKVTAADAAAVLRAVVQLEELSGQGKLNGDVDGIKGITIADAACILRRVVKLIPCFPVEAE